MSLKHQKKRFLFEKKNFWQNLKLYAYLKTIFKIQ